MSTGRDWLPSPAEKFRIKDMGELRVFLGIKIQQTEHGMMLSNRNYLRNLLVCLGMDKCKATSTPMEVKPPEDVEGESITE